MISQTGLFWAPNRAGHDFVETQFRHEKGDSRMQIHATAVALRQRAVLILGPSGSGKSTLALELMAAGAGLIADDRCNLARAGDRVTVSCPPALSGRIEARGIGLLAAEAHPPAPVVLVVDLGRSEDARLPPLRHYDLLDVYLPLVLGPYRPHLYSAVRQYVLLGRVD